MAQKLDGYVKAIPERRAQAAMNELLRRMGAEVLTAAKVLTENDSGRTYYLNAATEFAVTLPPPKLGLKFKFIVKAAPDDASYTVVTAGSSNVIKGHVLTTDVNSATDPDLETSGGDTITFVDSVAVAGDQVEVECDGTYWYASGRCTVYNAITITGS